MADLRRWITALAVLALFAGLASAQVGGGGGQALQCALQAQPTPALRAEGITEEIGDIVIICSGGNPINGAQVPQTNITISLTSQVTSRLLGNGFNWSEAILMLDEPGSGLSPLIAGTGPAAALKVCPTANTGCTAWTDLVTPNPPGPAIAVATSGPGVVIPPGGPPTNGSADLAFNAYQGIVAGNQVTFFGVPILAPGTTSARVIRITNVRTNANGIGGGSASGSIPVQASILSGNPFALPLSQATPVVGFVQQGLTTSVTAAGAFGQCNTQPPVPAGPTFGATQTALLGFSEGFGSSFKTRVDPTVAGQTSGQSGVLVQNKPGTLYNGESAFMVSPAALGIAAGFTAASTPPGLADAGTRLKAVFNNIPTGVRLFVSLYNVTRDVSNGAVTGSANGGVQPAPTSTTSFAQLVTGETVGDVSGFPGQTANTSIITVYNADFPGGAGLPLQVVEITPTSGNSASAVWEVLNTNTDALETFRFGAFISYTAAPGTNTPAAGSGTANLSFAPTSTVTGASSGPIPRFIDTSTAKTAISIAICRTVLLFPFVTNQVGFDTGLAISNTSTDPFGTTPQAGTCTLNWYGANSVPVITTPSVATATTYTTLASVAAPNFQGYMIAVCGFQYAHGFAFVSDIGARNLAMGYLALIVPDPGLNGGRAAADISKSVGNSGENLAH